MENTCKKRCVAYRELHNILFWPMVQCLGSSGLRGARETQVSD